MSTRKISLTFLFLAVLTAGCFLSFPGQTQAGTGKVVGDKFNFSYPRIASFMWSFNSEWLGQKGIDIAVWPKTTTIDIAAAKKFNSKLLVGATGDIQACSFDSSGDYHIYNNGQLVYAYDGVPACNITEAGYKAKVVETYASLAPRFDFFMSDGLREEVNFLGFPGDLLGPWKIARNDILRQISSATNNKPFIVNGDNCFGSHKELYNGSLVEYGGPFTDRDNGSWADGYGALVKCSGNRAPHLAILDGGYSWGSGFLGGDSEFKVMRFSLGTALLTDSFYAFQRFGVDNNHYYMGYFDEFDLDFGYPTGEAHCLKRNGASWLYQCVYVRFFDKGVIILNATGKAETISDGEIKSLAGYAGPYYSFKGGQDPAWNNGEKFSSANLAGYNIKTDSDNHRRIFGDALFLLKESKPVVADIIIDEHKLVTSPGNNPAELSGSWLKNKDGEKFWRMYHSDNGITPAHYYALATSAGATAIFRPTIGVSGRYTVYEWHGNSSAGSESTNISFELKGSDGIKTGSINQSANYGQWNLVGEMYLKAGTENYFKLINNSKGLILADAVKFVYEQAKLKADFNCDDIINIADFGILLSRWGKTSNLNFKHAQCQSVKNLDLSNKDSSLNKIDTADLGALLGCWGNPGNKTCLE